MAKISLRAPYEIRMGKWVQPLTDGEAYILLALMGRKKLDRNELAGVVWGPEHRWPLSIRGGINQRVFSLRKKLQPFGWTIQCSGTGRWTRNLYALERYEGKKVLAA